MCRIPHCFCEDFKGAVAKRVHAKAVREWKEEEEYEELCQREAFEAQREDGEDFDENVDYTNM